MHALIFPNDKSIIGNPYCSLLYSNMGKLGVVIEPFTLGRALIRKYDVFHLHWPEYYLNTPPLKALVGTIGLLFCIAWMRFRGTRIVWTAHNLHSHSNRYPSAERRFWRMITPMFDGYIALSESSARMAREQFPALAKTPGAVIPHGDYRSSYPATIAEADARARLGIPLDGRVVLFFGGINPYKNVPHLIRMFQRAEVPNSTLVVAGRPSCVEVEQLVKATACNDTRVQLHLKRVPEDEVQVFFKAADLVVLPFLEILNSGSAILALSFDKPVLVPDAGSLPELQRWVGTDWVRTYQDRLSDAELRSAIAWSRNKARAAHVNLAPFAWPSIARETLSLYEKLVSGNFAKSSVPPATSTAHES